MQSLVSVPPRAYAASPSGATGVAPRLRTMDPTFTGEPAHFDITLSSEDQEACRLRLLLAPTNLRQGYPAKGRPVVARPPLQLD